MFNQPDLLTHFLRIKGLMEYPRISPAKKKNCDFVFVHVIPAYQITGNSIKTTELYAIVYYEPDEF